MTQTILVTLFCPDRTGLIAALAGCLFDMGANLGDSTFAVLGEGAEWTAICDVPDDVSIDDVRTALTALPETAGGRLTVEAFGLQTVQGPSAKITHRLTLSGGDRPGLVARLAEVFVQYRANVVRLNSQRLPDDAGGSLYIVRVDLNVPDTTEASCLATVVNTAGEMGMTCAWEKD